jgi:cyanophycin synthetase
MELLEIKVMRGPNIWSNYRKKLIVLKLDIGYLEHFPTNKIDGFTGRLEKLLPSLYEHCCSERREGGFFVRVKEGTWMGHVIEHIALEIQSMAGMDCGFGRTRSTNNKGIYNIVFSYEVEEAGIFAAKAAVRIAEALVENRVYDLQDDISELQRINKDHSFGPSTLAIVNEAKSRNIPVKRMNKGSLVILGQGKKQKKIRAAMSSATSALGVEMACNKEETKMILAKAYVPVPLGELIYEETEIQEAIGGLTFPLVVKPIDGNHGRGITTNITHESALPAAFKKAKEISDEVIIEEFIPGNDYRFLVINFKLVAVAKRTPAMITGNGTSTVMELINAANMDPRRGEGHEKVMTKISIDEHTKEILTRHNLNYESVLAEKQVLYLRDTANISTGGTSTDLTDKVHPHNKLLAERVARLLNLDICGIDVVASDINVPLTKKTGAVVEVNACPGLRMHLNPAKGLARNVAAPIIDMLFPNLDTGRIPLVSITGTNGKTTTTRLIAHIAAASGHQVGFTTTDGIYIRDNFIHNGDCTGPSSAETVLLDPTIDFAVIECARGGILRSGLGFDHCDISVITNVTDDHLGLKDIHTLEEMANVKSVVAQSTSRNGYAILNADDDLVYYMKEELDCNVALFSLFSDNDRVIKHCSNGGLAAYIENGNLVISKGQWKTRVSRIDMIPLSFQGKADAMIKNILPATLVGVIRNFDLEVIREALHSFIPSPEKTPGRMNLFNFRNFNLMVDYAHNLDGFTELKKFMDRTDATVKVGIISATGDRREIDIRNIGHIAAHIFDEIIIRHDIDLRGRSAEEITRLLLEGIFSVKDIPVKVISSEKEAIHHAVGNAKSGAFIFVAADSVLKTIEYIEHEQLQEKFINKIEVE